MLLLRMTASRFGPFHVPHLLPFRPRTCKACGNPDADSSVAFLTGIREHLCLDCGSSLLAAALHAQNRPQKPDPGKDPA
jgi:hypothetical protein